MPKNETVASDRSKTNRKTVASSSDLKIASILRGAERPQNWHFVANTQTASATEPRSMLSVRSGGRGVRG